ncbi:MAG: GNAT family N-acetyltransferase [bacterium]|nr:GNAT family N-acetyltransferase [bacterium]
MRARAVEVVDVGDRAGLEEAWRIRFEVFVDEQHVPVEEEVDARDEEPGTLHGLAYVDGVPAGTGRVLPDGIPGHVHVGRMAVRAPFRGSGVGAALMAHLEGAALAEYGIPDGGGRLSVVVTLSAQESAMGFYSRLGYAVVSGERYLDAGIWHQDMVRTVTV